MRALILVDHGSRAAAANEIVLTMADQTRARGEYDLVEGAHMEIAEPSFEDVFARMVAAGATEVVVVPYMLGPGKHAMRDIPEMARRAAEAHDVTVHIGRPLGVDARLVDLVLARASQSLTPEDAA